MHKLSNYLWIIIGTVDWSFLTCH